MLSNKPKVALIHDDFIQSGGAENLFAQVASLFPDAPIYTSLVDWDKLPTTISRNRVRPSFMQKLPFATKIYKALLPLYPLAFESFDFAKYDLVISSTTRFAKSAITKPKTVHVCYINNIPRFLTNSKAQEDYLPKVSSIILTPFLKWLKRFDLVAASRPDYYIANSQNVATRVKKFYGRDSDVIYPCIDTNIFKPADNNQKPNEKYYLIVSRLVKWKRIDIAIQAAQELGINLKIVGVGPDETRLKDLTHAVIPTEAGIKAKDKMKILDLVENNASHPVDFLGEVTSEELISLYQNAQALIVTQEEDFGIAAVEAQACGIPVIAYGRGGVTETVIQDKTGILFNEQSPKSLSDAISKASRVKWNDIVCRKNSLRFDKAVFEKQFKDKIASYAKRPQ